MRCECEITGSKYVQLKGSYRELCCLVFVYTLQGSEFRIWGIGFRVCGLVYHLLRA